jgi:CRISPR-associated protein Csd1
MLIKALCEYYDILEEKGQVTPEGYSKVKIDYMICLTPKGDIDEIIDIRERREVIGKNNKLKIQYYPRQVLLPERTQKPGIDYNIIEHRPLYIFGLNLGKDGFTPFDKTNKALKSHDIFVKENLKFIEGINQPLVNAYRLFLEKWKPEEQITNRHLLKLGNDYSKCYYAFCLSGEINKPLHQVQEINHRWNECFSEQSIDLSETKSQCAITGQVLPIARIHNKIKGIKGGQAAGGVLVSFKNDSESSYNKSQSYNSNISEKSMKKYTESLNILLSDKLHKTNLDDVTVLHWAQSVNNEKLDTVINWMTFDDNINEDELDLELKNVLGHIKKGLSSDFKSLNIDKNTDYYIVGLTPNNSRISIKFIYKEKFGNIVSNVLQHQIDLALESNERKISLWKIKNELISPKSSEEKISPQLITEIFRSIMFGTHYPRQLLSTAVKRVKIDSDTEESSFIKVNATRIGIIKACINRNLRLNKKEEVIKMALDTNNNNPAYLCGRLFALLEKIQSKASNDKINKTIKDSYFASACSTPAMVFPRLLMLSQNHLSKIENGFYWNNLLGKIMNMIGQEFPQTLTLTEQGMFIIGYYQQYYYKEDKSEK